MSQNVTDLEDIVLNWGADFYKNSSYAKDIEELNSSDIDWSGVRIIHDPAVYTDQITSSTPKTQVLYTAHFVNNTEEPQTFALRSERKTTSITKVSMEKTFTKGFSMDLKIQAPNPVVEANAGFKGEMSINNANEETFEEQLTWSVNNSICVAPKMKVTAELVLTEIEYSFKFSCKTNLDGFVQVAFRSKKRTKPIRIATNVQKIFTPEFGFDMDTFVTHFVSKGDCRCKFGIEQHVRLSENPL